MRLQARNKNGHHYVNIDLEDNAIVQIDGKQIHPPKQVELTPEPPLSERLEVGAKYEAPGDGVVEYTGKVGGNGHAPYIFRGSDGWLMRLSENEVNSELTFVSRPRLSETVRPGWKIKCPNRYIDTITISAITEIEYRYNGDKTWRPLSDLDKPGWEVVSKG